MNDILFLTAHSLAGGGRTASLLPLGMSGVVIRREGMNPLFFNCSSTVTEKSDVPKNAKLIDMLKM